MSENKVQFGLSKCYYAKITESGSDHTYGTPVAIPGGVNLNLSAQGEMTKFYADNKVYYQASANNGYEGDLEVARVPEAMLKDIFGYTEGATSKVFTENVDTEPSKFALLFQIDGDAADTCYVLYDCVASRPALASGTIQTSKEPVTQSISISAVGRPADGKVLAKTGSETTSTVISGWFSTVFVES